MLLQMSAYRQAVGRRLLALREQKGLSQEDAAHAVGVSVATWGRWERGARYPYEANWRKISDTFDVDLAEIRGSPPAPLALGADNGDGIEATLARMDSKLDAILEHLADEKLRDAAARSTADDAPGSQRAPRSPAAAHRQRGTPR